jgi:hypothetical protein
VHTPAGVIHLDLPKMPCITAYLTIGKVDPFEGFVPTHWAYLAEIPNLKWHIAPWGVYPNGPQPQSIWTTSANTVIGDMMVMMSSVVEGRSWAIYNVTNHFGGETVDLSKLSTLCRVELDHLAQTSKYNFHLILTILADSVLCGQTHNLARYDVSADICTASYSQDGSLANADWGKRRDGGASPGFRRN